MTLKAPPSELPTAKVSVAAKGENAICTRVYARDGTHHLRLTKSLLLTSMGQQGSWPRTLSHIPAPWGSVECVAVAIAGIGQGDQDDPRQGRSP